MKKVLVFLLAIAMVVSLVACTGGQTESKEVFKIGAIDMGTADATSAPLLNQLKMTAEALGCEYDAATPASMSGEDYAVAVQNLIAAGCDFIIVPAMMSVQAMADLCDPAGVYWSFYWYGLEEGTEEYEIAMNSEYFVSTTYEDDVHSAYWAASVLGNLGCKNICVVGLPTGDITADRRDLGIAQACSEYGMTILAEERDFALTTNAAGGATIAERFLAAYPECDGILIAGMTQFVLPGVVQTLTQTGQVGTIKVAGIDFNEYQFEYMESGALSGIIGGHFAGPTYSAILAINKLNGTPLTDEKVILENKFIELADNEQAQTYANYISNVGYLYSEEEIKNCLIANNPDFTFEDLKAMADSYSLQDLLDRNGN